MHRRIVVASGAVLLFLSAYSDDTASSSTGSLSGDASGKAAEVNVSTAASLKESFGEMKKKFESVHPDVDFVFNFVGSQEFVEQINSDVPANVVAMANTATVGALKFGGKIVGAKIFASDTLILITPKGNPAMATGPNPSLDKAKLVICTPRAFADGKAMPCGTATAELVRKLGMKLNPASEEQKTTDACSKMMPGEADAGTVYRTDAVVGGKEVETIEIPGANMIVSDYPVGVVKASKNSPRAKALAEYATSWEGQATPKKHGLNKAGAGGR